MHLEDAADPLLLVGARVLDVRTCGQDAGVGAHETQAADERVGGDLEGEAGERLVRIAVAHHLLLLVVGVHADDLTDIVGRREVTHHGVEHRLDALVLEGGTAEHRRDVHGDGRLADGLHHLGFGDAVGILEELLHEGIVLLGNSLDELLAVLGNGVHQVIGNRNLGEGHALVLLVPDHGLARQQVDHTLEVVLGTDGHLQGDGVGAEHLADLLEHVEEVGTGAVHLVDETDAGHLVLVGEAPIRLGLGFHTGHGAEESHRSVEDAQ